MRAKAKRGEAAELLLPWLSEREGEMASLVADFVAVPTENPPGRYYKEFAELFEGRIASLGLRCERVEPLKKDSAADIIAPCLSVTYGKGERIFYFHGHYDVVPAQSEEQFQPIRKDHFLFGRGACDMKGGIVSMLYAILALRECGVEIGGKIQLILVPDEETVGARGSAGLAEQGTLGRNGVGMLLAEPTSGVVWNANRGAISLRVQIHGKAAHVGLQHQGENAFERMHTVVERLQKLKQEVEQRPTTTNIGAGQSRNSILMLGGQSGGGTNFNVVPESCWFTIDRRINPEEDLAEERERLVGLLRECQTQGVPLQWEILQEGDSASTEQTKAAGQALSQAILEVTGKAASFELCPGLLETRFYAVQRIASYAYGPGLLSVAHGPNEYVDMRRVTECAVIYALTAAKVFEKSAS